MKMEITHIFHSGFILETDDIQMVFDYYKGDIDLKDKSTIVFVTHGHADHYTENIFKWQESVKDIRYVISSDIEDAPISDNIFIMNPYEELILGDLNIRSFGSTDLGLSFIINYKNIDIFFAGDLNWWHWENDTKEEQLDEEKQFKSEIKKMKMTNTDFDIAFVPVDPRLNDAFSLTGEYFIDEFNPSYFLPMHFGDNFDTSKKFINKMGDVETHIVDINKENQIIEIEV